MGNEGLQLERTVLAWSRSALGFAVLCLAICRISLNDASPITSIVCLVIAISAFALCAVIVRPKQWRAPAHDGSALTTISDARPLLALTLLAALLCVAALVATFTL